MSYLPAIVQGEITDEAKSFLQACAIGVGVDTFIVNVGANSIDDDVTICTLMGGRSADPNRIGFAGKPVRTDFTPTGWSDDTGYVAGAAGVATLVGGYDHVCNQIAGIIVGGGHNFIKYNVNGHSAIVGGSYNIISAGRGFIGAGRANSITGDDTFTVIVGGDQNESRNSSWGFMGGGTSNILTSADWGVVVCGQSNTVSANYSTVINGNTCVVSGGYSWAVGLNLTNAYSYAGLIGRDATTQADYSLTIGGALLKESNDRKTYTVVAGLRTTNATSTGMNDSIDMPAGKIVAGIIRATLVAMRDGSADGNNDADYSVATYTAEVGFYWNGSEGFFHTVSGETATSAGPLQFMTVVRDNITLGTLPQFRLNTGQLRINVTGIASTIINWVARLEIAQTLVS